MKKIKKTTLTVTKKTISPIVAKIEKLNIKDQKSLAEGVTYLSQANKYLDSVIAWKENKTIPLNEALKVVRAETKPMEDMLKGLIKDLRSKMEDYKTTSIVAVQEQEEQIVKELESGDMDVDSAMNAIGEIKTVEKKIETDSGSVTFIPVEDFEVMDLTMVPVEYLLPNEVMIRKAMKEGVKLAGVRYFIRQQIRNDR